MFSFTAQNRWKVWIWSCGRFTSLRNHHVLMGITPAAQRDTSTAQPSRRCIPRTTTGCCTGQGTLCPPTASTLIHTQGPCVCPCPHRTQRPVHSLRALPEGTVPSCPPCVACPGISLPSALLPNSPLPHPLWHNPILSLLCTQSLWLSTVFHSGEIPI